MPFCPRSDGLFTGVTQHVPQYFMQLSINKARLCNCTVRKASCRLSSRRKTDLGMTVRGRDNGDDSEKPFQVPLVSAWKQVRRNCSCFRFVQIRLRQYMHSRVRHFSALLGIPGICKVLATRCIACQGLPSIPTGHLLWPRMLCSAPPEIFLSDGGCLCSHQPLLNVGNRKSNRFQKLHCTRKLTSKLDKDLSFHVTIYFCTVEY